MKFVQRAEIRPNHCVIYPSLGASHPKGYFQGVDLPGFDNKGYVSVHAVEEMALALGWERPGQQEAYDAVLAEKDAEIAALRDELGRAQAKLEAVYVLKQAGFQAQRKPGRPPKEKAVS